MRDAKIADEYLSERSGLRRRRAHIRSRSRISRPETRERADAVAAHCIALALAGNRMPAATVATSLRGSLRPTGRLGRGRRAQCRCTGNTSRLGHSDDYAETCTRIRARSSVALHHNDDATAQERMQRLARLRTLLTYGRPLLSVATLLEMARVYADMADTAGAREVIRQARDVLRQRPDLGTLPAPLDAFWNTRLETMQTGSVGASSLTAAELRLVPYLPTHLTLAEIAQRLHVSRNTRRRKRSRSTKSSACRHGAQPSNGSPHSACSTERSTSSDADDDAREACRQKHARWLTTLRRLFAEHRHHDRSYRICRSRGAESRHEQQRSLTHASNMPNGPVIKR